MMIVRESVLKLSPGNLFPAKTWGGRRGGARRRLHTARNGVKLRQGGAETTTRYELLSRIQEPFLFVKPASSCTLQPAALSSPQTTHAKITLNYRHLVPHPRVFFPQDPRRHDPNHGGDRARNSREPEYHPKVVNFLALVLRLRRRRGEPV